MRILTLIYTFLETDVLDYVMKRRTLDHLFEAIFCAPVLGCASALGQR